MGWRKRIDEGSAGGTTAQPRHAGDGAGRRARDGRNPGQGDTRATFGRQAEDIALGLLQPHGLSLLQRNYRVAHGPSRHAGEIDLVLRDRDGTLVFVEVRARREGALVPAAATIDARKRARILYAARCYLSRLVHVPPCRFDVVTVDGSRIEWIRAAFDAD